ncbi:MAG: hypothetical protein ACRCX2_27205 [Paraclostridium sp.]
MKSKLRKISKGKIIRVKRKRFTKCTTEEMSKSAMQLLKVIASGGCSVSELLKMEG